MSNDTTFEDLKKDYNDLSIDKPSIISSTEREKMLLKTARSLPDNPADSGMKASAVKPKFYSFATDTADSLYAYFNRAVGVINTAFDNIIEKINTQFGDNKDQIDDILDAITTFKTTYSTYVAQMKTTIDNINDNIESVEEDISDINDDIADINNDIIDINADLETKQTAIETNASDIATINENIDDIGTSISGLEESISTTNGRIDDTNQSISDTNTNLATTNSNLEITNTNLSNEITNRENAISDLLGNASEGYNTLGSLQSKLLEAIDTLNTTISNHSNATGNIHSVYGNQVAMSESNAKTITSALNDLASQIELLGGFNDQTSADFSSLTDRLSAVENHTSNTSNPHSVTKAQVGLGSVDNTSDINKPVSTAQASAIATAKSEATAYADTKVSEAITTASTDATSKSNSALTSAKTYADTKASEVQTNLDNHINKGKEVNLSSAFTSRITASDETNSKYEIKDKSIAKVKSISGYSKKSNNLLNIADVASTTSNGITYSIKNGVITLNGTATSAFYLNLPLIDKVGTYTFTLFSDIVSGTNYRINSSYLAWDRSATINNSTISTLYIGIISGSVISNKIITPMLVEGTVVPTTFEPYIEGIVNSTATKIVSTGENLWNEKIAINNVNIGNANTTFSASGFKSILNIPCKPSNSYSINGVKVITYVDSNKTEISRNYIDTTNNYTFTTPLNCYYISVSTPSANKVMLNNGSTVSTYQEYASQTLSIPSEVQALEGYGWGLSTTDKSLNNYIDYENKKFIQNVGRVDMGTLDWYYLKGVFYTAPIATMESTNKVVCGKYKATDSVVSWNIVPNGQIELFKNVAEENKVSVIICDNNYTDTVVFKNAINGEYLYYPLATPIETDISQYLTDDTYVAYNLGTETIDTDYPCLAEITYNADLDKQVVENADNIAKLKEDVVSNEASINAVQANTSANTSAIEELQTNVSTNTSSISTNTSSISTNASNISSLQASVQANTNNISTNSSNISTIQTSIGTINSKLLTYIDCELDDYDDISCAFDTSVITKDNAQNYAVKMKVYNSDSEQHNYQYLYFDRIECKEIEGTPYYGFFDFYYGNANHTFLLERTINGANAIDEVAYENGYNVKNATTAISAMKADYASDDHTKGTIEERLTTLGFKEGVATYTGFASPTVNSLRKVGKFVIFNFCASYSEDIQYKGTITIPEGFRPKSDVSIYLNQGATYQVSILKFSLIDIKTIGTSGVINGAGFTKGYPIEILNAGWEVE